MEGSDVAERDVRIDAFAHRQGSFLLTVEDFVAVKARNHGP
jgi:hypothetical protein